MRKPPLVTLAVFAACSSAPPPTPAPPAAPAAPPAASATPAAGPGSAAPEAAATSAPTAAPGSSAAPAHEPAESGACPTDMKLVEGDYCTEVEQKCQKSWFDKSNKKVICEKFEPPSR